MYGLEYTAAFENASVTAAAQDIFEILTSADTPIIIHGITLTAGVTTQEIARLQFLIRTTAGSGGSSVTPRATAPRNTLAADTVVNRTVTTPGSAGNVFWAEQWNIAVPFDKALSAPELKIYVPAATRVALNLAAALGGSRNMSGYITFSEL